ncbi:proteasome component ECM29 [Entomortierella parvispora]|uniref:Proteasome component ECM29 n=1 Tax=Entomortierella parvispora TaxID=205924 RepID=A0A9P3LXT1_9FUNG|nr:proteasome component ECM29 [Entomortierella parvispora]
MADKDLQLLDNVELRFALAETDAQLEKTLATFLCPVLLKLASPVEAVRAKVVGILTHINKRIRPKPSIKLPLAPLLQQFSDNGSVLVKNFTLIYVELGFERVELEEKVASLPKLIKGISQRPAAQQTTIVHMVLPALAQIKQHNEDNTTSDPYEFLTHPADAICILTRLQDVLLYRQPTIVTPTGHSHGTNNSGPSSPLTGATPAASTTPASATPDGMSPQSVLNTTYNGKATWANSSELKNIKTGALRFICSTTAFPDALPLPVQLERFIAMIAATGDSYYEASSMGEDGLKRTKLPDLEDKLVVDRLFQMFQGFNRGKPVAGQESIFRQPSSNIVKLKIMGYLSKSKTAAESFPSALQVSFDCLYGPKTNTKLVMAGMAFVQWMARMSSEATLAPIAPVLVSGLLKYTRENEEARGLESDAAKGFAYVAISLISKRIPSIFRKDLSIVEGFFEQLATQPPNVKTYIQEAICTMLDAFQPLKDWAAEEDTTRIVSMIEHNMNKDEHQARYCAVKYATGLFDFSDIASKYICLMTIADEKLEIREEAKRGLTFPTAGTLSENTAAGGRSILPDFIKLVDMINFKSKTLQNRTDEVLSKPTFGKAFIMGFPSEVFIHILEFFRRLLITSADPDVIIEESSNEYELQQFVFTPETRRRVKAWLKEMWDKDNQIDNDQKTLTSYISFLEIALNHQGPLDKNLHSTALTCLLELFSLAPSSLSQQYSHRLNWFKPYIGSPKVESRQAVAHIIGIVATDDLGEANPQRQVFQQFFGDLLTLIKDTTKQTTTEQRHGSILAVGYILGRLLYRYPNAAFDIIPRSEFEEVVQLIVGDLDSKQNLFVSGACIALGEIGRYGVIPGPHPEKDIEKLIATARDTKDIKTQEYAIASLGHIGVGNPANAQEILKFFYDFGPKQTKQTEVNFTIGEAIACIGAGWQCTAMDVFADVADQEPTKQNITDDVMDSILAIILNEMAPSPKAATKKAACIWLLSLVKFCSTHPSVKLQLPRLHSVFSSLLSDRDELTQEIASKGIGLVYELGDQSIRSQLVGSLVGMFGEGKKATQKITGDTELFDSNALGQAPDGSSLSTYQSILSLASDMNQPELVYKFMHLASHNSMWQSRKGAAFGFSSIVSQAEAELKPHLATLIPRLYRYQYDPNPKVNEAMTSIWRALVKEPKKAVQEYFDVIIRDLLEGMGARAWRTRESSCSAMADLLQGRSVEEIEKYLENIWTMSFRALDDIKESVRLAAFKTCRALTLMTVKYCDPKNVTAAEGQRVLDIMVPFLVQKGLLSSAEEVSKFSLTTILKICKQAGPLLRSHIPLIVGALLEGLTSMEPQMMNYLSFHTEKYQVSQEQLESSRLNAAKLSPMMEGIEACIENIDDSVMNELSVQLSTMIRKAVGLPTKAGCAHLLVSICIKKPAVMRPYSDAILKTLGAALKDKSPAVRKSYAVAVGYLARLTTDAALVKFVERQGENYLSTEDEELRSVPAIVIREISKNAADKFKGVASSILPIVYYGSFDPNKDINAIWKEVWEEHTNGSSSAVKLYATELVEVLSKQLTSASWNAKKQSAQALKGVSEVMDLSRDLDNLLPLIIDGLSGRTWQGKEHVVELLAAVTANSKDYFTGKKDKLQEIAKVLLRESKKVNKQYRRYAIDSLGKFLDTFKEVDYYVEVKSMLFTILENKEDEDGEDEEMEKPLQLVVMASAAKALGLAWTRNPQLQAQHAPEFVEKASSALVRNIWNVRSGLLESFENFFAKLNLTGSEAVLSDAALTVILDSLLEGSLRDFKYVSIRNQGLQLVKNIAEKLKGTAYYTPTVKAKLHEVLQALRKDPLPSISEEATLIESSL